MSTIHYRDMVKAMDADQNFSMVYLNCNRKKITGGDWVSVGNVKKCGLPYNCADHEMRGYMDVSGKITAFHLRLVYQYNGMTVHP